MFNKLILLISLILPFNQSIPSENKVVNDEKEIGSFPTLLQLADREAFKSPFENRHLNYFPSDSIDSSSSAQKRTMRNALIRFGRSPRSATLRSAMVRFGKRSENSLNNSIMEIKRTSAPQPFGKYLFSFRLI
uniref:Uncharacterized protein n=1 Tax=Meloidogyne hapla TaxID=6305 RepID=A0A1I8B5R1_MELHA